MVKAVGESYDGYCDPEVTPNNWARAAAAVSAALAALLAGPTEGTPK